MVKVLHFNQGQKASLGGPTTSGATKWQIWKGNAWASLGQWLCRIRCPGFVEDIALNDQVTGRQLTISSSPYFTRISVNGRDYYFDRLTGRFDGTGMGLCS